MLCHAPLTRRAAARHLATCAPRHDRAGGTAGDLWHLRVEGQGYAAYWMDLEIKGSTTLRSLDRFLRRAWLECCGHMSAFEIGGERYTVLLDREFDMGRVEHSMDVRVSDVLEPGERFGYEYDFGSTTLLALTVLGVRLGLAGRAATRLLARNDPPVWPCAVCGKPASVLCPYCRYKRNPFSCGTHVGMHECDEGDAELPVVNSPRMGVCGYTG